MPTSTRTRRSTPATTGRFSRTTTTPRSRTGRRATPQRRMVAGGWVQRRRPPKQSALKRMLGGASGAMSGKSGKAGGLALLAGAAGMLFKNRDKVTSKVRGGGQGPHAGDPGVATPMTTTGGPGGVPKL